jgi:hypothetical protein
MESRVIIAFLTGQKEEQKRVVEPRYNLKRLHGFYGSA